MQNKALLFLIIVVAFSISGCGRSSIDSVVEYNEWLNDTDNGCIRSKSINGGKVSVKYQPASYLLLKEVEKGNYKPYDKAKYLKLINDQDRFITFLMTIGPDDEKVDPKTLSYDGQNFTEYVDKILASNFLMSNYLSLYIGKSKCPFTGCMVENIYELSPSRNFIVIFENPFLNSKVENYLFVFEDPFFAMGKLQFEFKTDAIINSKELFINYPI